MKHNLPLFGLSILLMAQSCHTPSNQTYESLLMKKTDIPYPIAEKEAYYHEMHGDKRLDNYQWMRLTDEQKLAEKPDAQTQRVLDYLNAENEYRVQMMAHTATLQEQLFEEIKGRIKQDDMSVPYKENGYYYSTRYEEGKEYPLYTRRAGSMDNTEEIMLNVNELASNYSYYQIGGLSVSPNNKLLAYSEDTLSRRSYTIKIKNLESGELLADVLPKSTGSIVWGNDNKTLFYTQKDAALRSFKVIRHLLGTPSSEDVEVYHEKDETFSTGIFKTKSKQFLVIASSATLSNEYRILEADNPQGEFRLFDKRERNLEYSIEHFEDQWFITTNKDNAVNFKVMTTPLTATNNSNWKDFIPHNPQVLIEDISIFKDFMTISVRDNGFTKIAIRFWDGKQHYIGFEEETYTVEPSINPDFETEVFRLNYTSLTTPSSTFDYNVKTQNLALLKQQEVIGNFKASDYQSEKHMAKAADGTLIPISLVYKKGYKKDGSHPLLLYAYGSYGYSMDPYFSSARLSLLDRGFAFAIAHIRGGQEMGRHWYEEGKFLKKINTFTDYIACAEHLIASQICGKNNLFAMGGSAGGLLMGAVVNMRPELFRGVIAAVPFVDVVSTMLDESIPLTTGEFDEWGNPKDPVYYEYMKSYSPLDNVRNQNYPAMLVTTGYHDSQVQYWEPAKWVAKLRDMKTDKNPLLLYCNMDTGHGGASGRFKRFKETAMEYAFLLDLANIQE